jgi:hypothetical protein
MDRDKLVGKISAIIACPTLGFIPSWRSYTTPQLLTMLEGVEDPVRLEALYRTVKFFASNLRSRMTLLTYLLHPPASEETWQTILTIGAHYRWLMKTPSMYDPFIYLVGELKDKYGIEPDAKGRVKSIVTHIEVKDDYGIKRQNDLYYVQNKKVVQFVEKHYRHKDAVISYAGKRGYTGLSDSDFKEYLKQHKALQEGWL